MSYKTIINSPRPSEKKIICVHLRRIFLGDLLLLPFFIVEFYFTYRFLSERITKQNLLICYVEMIKKVKNLQFLCIDFLNFMFKNTVVPTLIYTKQTELPKIRIKWKPPFEQTRIYVRNTNILSPN